MSRIHSVNNNSTFQEQKSITISQTEKQGEEINCLVCYCNLLELHRGILPCNHNDVCAHCHLRLRSLHSDLRCPVCKKINEKIIVNMITFKSTSSSNEVEIWDHNKTHAKSDVKLALKVSDIHSQNLFDSYDIWGENMGEEFIYLQDVGMFFPRSYHSTVVVPLLSMKCNVLQCNFINEMKDQYHEYKNSDLKIRRSRQHIKRLDRLTALQHHLRKKHFLKLCQLCLDRKIDFVSRLPLFTDSMLKNHEENGDKNTGFRGHPMCQFCRPRRFYDLTELHEHLNQHHYKCHICDRKGKMNNFYNNYEKLSLHFERDHFLCPNPQCLVARFVVFENEIDLRAHELSTHGISSAPGGSTKINLEFRFRRDNHKFGDTSTGNTRESREDVFIPDSLPGYVHDQSYTVHVERTAHLRAEAAQMRPRHVQEEEKEWKKKEDFPLLVGDSSSTRNLTGWSNVLGTFDSASLAVPNENPIVMTDKNFPMLVRSNKMMSSSSNNEQTMVPKPIVFRKTNEGKIKLSRSMATYAQSARVALNATSSVSRPITHSFALSNSKKNYSTRDFPSLGRTFHSSRNTQTNPVVASYQMMTAKSHSTRKVDTSYITPAMSSIHKHQIVNKPYIRKELSIPLSLTSCHFTSESLSFKDIFRIKVARAVSYKYILSRSSTMISIKKETLPLFSTTSIYPSQMQIKSVKAMLGPVKYKKLRRVTKEFSANNISAEDYIETIRTIFIGENEKYLLTFMSNLISSIPKETVERDKALRLFENLRLYDEKEK